MTPDLQLWIFMMFCAGLVVTVLLVLLLVKLVNRKSPPAVTQGAVQFYRRVPDLALLPEAQQRSIVRRAAVPPALLALGGLLTFAWVAIGSDTLLSFVNEGNGSAKIVALGLLAAIIFPVVWLQTVLVRRAVARARR